MMCTEDGITVERTLNTEHCIACTPKEDGIALGSSDNVCSATCPAIQTDLPGC